LSVRGVVIIIDDYIVARVPFMVRAGFFNG
jgi:hypothetical protein